MEEHKDYDLALRVGELTGQLKEVVGQIKENNQKLDNIVELVSSHDKVINYWKGKIAGMILAFSLVGTVVVEFLKDKLNKYL